MKAEYIRLIAVQDCVLKHLRSALLDSRNRNERCDLKCKIDDVLDERIRLMKLRDASQ
jgi:hypothetical protein